MGDDMNQLVKGVAHVGIRVASLERSLAFYRHFGFELVAGPMGPEPVVILKNAAGTELNLILNAQGERAHNVLMDEPVKHAGYTHIALECDDIAAAMVELERVGIPLSGGPVKFPHGHQAIFVRDPDRNVLELHQGL
jgi:lactoylglutathione lyase